MPRVPLDYRGRDPQPQPRPASALDWMLVIAICGLLCSVVGALNALDAGRYRVASDHDVAVACSLAATFALVIPAVGIPSRRSWSLKLIALCVISGLTTAMVITTFVFLN